jgi:hypothetical protein
MRLMKWLIDHIGGRISSTDKRGRRPCYCWAIASARDVYHILSQVLPYLVLKKTLAVSTMEYLTTKYGEDVANGG